MTKSTKSAQKLTCKLETCWCPCARCVISSSENSCSYVLTCWSSSVLFSNITILSSYFMRGGKEHARSTQPIVQDEGSIPRASGSGDTQSSGPLSTRHNPQPSDTQPTETDEWPSNSARSSAESNSEFYQDVLIRCNSLIERYRKGEIPKVSVYVEIQSKLSEALGIREW